LLSGAIHPLERQLDAATKLSEVKVIAAELPSRAEALAQPVARKLN
jgi:hypothetical protein